MNNIKSFVNQLMIKTKNDDHKDSDEIQQRLHLNPL